MPYYQIKHLQALESYLDLFGLSDATRLPAGKGNPPQEDPQVFLEALPYSPLCSSPVSPPCLPIKSLPNTPHHSCCPHLFAHCRPMENNIIRSLPNVYDMAPCGINHLYFTRLNDTLYLLRSPKEKYKKLLHVGQIMAYLSFDQYVRKHNGGKLSSFPGIPLSYSDFALTFNAGKHASDLREVSLCTNDDQGNDVIPVTGLVITLSDFHIRPEHCGHPPPPPKDTIPKEYVTVMEQFAIQTATSNKRKKEFFKK